MNACPTPDPPEPDGGEIAWPPERFYWAIVEPASSPVGPVGWTRDGPVPAGLLADVADQVPAPIEDLHGVVAAAGDGRLVVCLARRDELLALTADPTVRSLTPASIPSVVDNQGDLEPERLNLLVGAFEPMPTRRARVRKHLLSAAALVLLAGLVTLGLARREAADRRAAALVQQASQLLLTEMGIAAQAGEAGRGGGEGGAGEERLKQELEERRRMAGADLASHRVPDAAVALNQVLTTWPADSAADLQSISLGPDGAVLSVLLAAPGDPASFLSKLQPVEGWTLEEPRLVAVGSGTRMTLRMRPPPAGSRALSIGTGPTSMRIGNGGVGTAGSGGEGGRP